MNTRELKFLVNTRELRFLVNTRELEFLVNARELKFLVNIVGGDGRAVGIAETYMEHGFAG